LIAGFFGRENNLQFEANVVFEDTPPLFESRNVNLKDMQIDVIIPTFNRASVLPKAIASVIEQSFQDFQLYIIDDGSTDETRSVVEKYLQNQKVHYFHQKNQGVSSSRNHGIKISSSEWICFLDSDDEWLPQKLATQSAFSENNPQFNFIHSNEIWIRNGIRVNAKARFDKGSQDLFKRSLELCLISPSTVMLKRELIQKHNYFDETFEICEDYDLWLKILATEEVGFISENLIKKYGGHEDQLSTKYPAMDFWRIRSMIKLLSTIGNGQKREQLQLEIEKKSLVLMQGFEKHQQHQKKIELLNLLKLLP